MKVSVITVVLNNFKGIEDTILSVIQQTAKSHIEFIIIDGQSTDGTLEIIHKYKKDIDILISERDNGIYDAMNKEIMRATGEYIIFMNAGDSFFDINVVQRFIIECPADKYDIVIGDIAFIKNGQIKIEKSPDQSQLTANTLYNKALCHQSAFIKREIIKNEGYDINYKICADKKFFIEQLILKDKTYKHLDFCVVLYDIDGISAKNYWLTQNETLKNFKSCSLGE